MKTVRVGDLQDHLSGYLQHVRDGEEMLVPVQDEPMAQSLPVPARLGVGFKVESV